MVPGARTAGTGIQPPGCIGATPRHSQPDWANEHLSAINRFMPCYDDDWDIVESFLDPWGFPSQARQQEPIAPADHFDRFGQIRSKTRPCRVPLNNLNSSDQSARARQSPSTSGFPAPI
jgi:hypothetical protein